MGTDSLAGRWSTVFGFNNDASGDSATVSGGRDNTAAGRAATVGGGVYNSAAHWVATVGGGYGNAASGAAATVGGGDENIASGLNATVGGGLKNRASGYRSTVPGGERNTAAGRLSFAAGYMAQANHDGSFVWADSAFYYFASTADNQFLVRASGGVGLGINTAYSQLTVNGHITPGADSSYDLGTSTWRWRDIFAANGVISTSDARQKDNINDLEYGLDEVLKLRPVSFTWKDRMDDQKHLGFVAQEVQPVISEVVNIGDDPEQTLGLRYEKLVPVLVNAIQELSARNEVLTQRVEELEASAR
jgi:hypothetical protein